LRTKIEQEHLATKLKAMLDDGQHESTTDKDEEKFKEFAEKFAEQVRVLQEKQVATSPAA